MADMDSCEILPPHVSAMLLPLRALIEVAVDSRPMPQIELAVGEDGDSAGAAHHGAAERGRRADCCEPSPMRITIQFWLQPQGPETADAVLSARCRLHYTAAGIRRPHAVQADRLHPGEPPDQPRAGVRRACALQAEPGDRVADLFCGLGNFTLPLATRRREVVGIEGSTTLTERALDNARPTASKTCRSRPEPVRSHAPRTWSRWANSTAC